MKDLEYRAEVRALKSLGPSDFRREESWIWWGPGDPRTYERFVTVDRLSPSSFLVQTWDVEDIDDDEGVFWICRSLQVYRSDFAGRTPSAALAGAVGLLKMDAFPYSYEKDSYNMVSPEELFGFPSEWIERIYGRKSPALTIDPFTGEEVWVVYGGSYWKSYFQEKSVRFVEALKGKRRS